MKTEKDTVKERLLALRIKFYRLLLEYSIQAPGASTQNGKEGKNHGSQKPNQARENLYPVPQKAPSVNPVRDTVSNVVKAGMNGKGFPEVFFPKATPVKAWYGVYFNRKEGF